tara:strand:- start:854 stop:1588 length:735 start_codon:yes stop_codon:yes gene_type:complete
MEKVIFLLIKEDNLDNESFKDSLVNDLPSKITKYTKSIQVNVVDEFVSKESLSRAGPEAAKLLPSSPVADAMLAVWVHSISAIKHIESELKSHTKSFHGYLVTESEPLPNKTIATSPTVRTPGFDQIAFLQKPFNMDYTEWLYNWQELHTQVAIDTQSTCRYIQNVIVRPLTREAPDYQAIVEEGYADSDAMFDPMIFYDAQGDKDKMLKNIELMMNSCSRFIDFNEQPNDMIGMSQYLIKIKN